MVMLTDRLDMTIVVDWDVKAQNKPKKKKKKKSLLKHYALISINFNR